MHPESLKKIHEISKKQKSVPKCTADNPAPLEQAHSWLHFDSECLSHTPQINVGDKVHMRCPHCGYEFTLTFRKL